jgi:hypothetical protein
MSLRTALRCTLAFLAVLTFSVSANAQLFRAYLAPTGSDSNPCTLPAPCRLLPAALTAVASGGEIWMLDSANFNTSTVNVTKSVTILAVPGALGSVVAAGGPAFRIATAGVKVALRNLVIVPLPGGGGTDGIAMTDGTLLDIENCLIANHGGTGISVSGGAIVRVADTTIRDNALHGVLLQDGPKGLFSRVALKGNADAGLYVLGTIASTTTTASIADSTLSGHVNAVAVISGNATAAVSVSVRDSRIVGNSTFGIGAQSNAGGVVSLSASNNLLSQNNIGLGAINAGAKVWASGNTVNDNATGFYNSAGSLFESAGNNAVRNNGADTTGTITAIATK